MKVDEGDLQAPCSKRIPGRREDIPTDPLVGEENPLVLLWTVRAVAVERLEPVVVHIEFTKIGKQRWMSVPVGLPDHADPKQHGQTIQEFEILSTFFPDLTLELLANGGFDQSVAVVGSIGRACRAS